MQERDEEDEEGQEEDEEEEEQEGEALILLAQLLERLQGTGTARPSLSSPVHCPRRLHNPPPPCPVSSLSQESRTLPSSTP